jgi:hypothetical protein
MEDVVDSSKVKLPAGIDGIAIVLVFSGLGYISAGILWLPRALDPSIILPSLLYVSFLFGGGIVMIEVGRELVRLKMWALWGSYIMFIAMFLLVVINPFASIQLFDSLFDRVAGAAACFIITCYLAIPAVRTRFTL